MIVKLGETLQWQSYRKRDLSVKAVRMREEFLYETPDGWIQGHKGQWLVEESERVRHAYDDEAFLRTYRPAERRKGERRNES